MGTVAGHGAWDLTRIELPEDAPTDPDPKRVAAAWLRNVGIKGDKPDSWAWSVLDDLVRFEPAMAWQVIEAIVASKPKVDHQYALGAGPLEDLLSDWPDELERAVDYAARSRAFRRVLSGMYQHGMSDATYLRAMTAAGTPTEVDDLLGTAQERQENASAHQEHVRAWRRRHYAYLHVERNHATRDGSGRTALRLRAGSTDQDARDVWCDVIQHMDGWDASRIVLYDARDRHRVWPAPRDCSDPDDVPQAVQEPGRRRLADGA